MTKAPTKITSAQLDVLVMPNGEIICLGKTVGWVSTHGPYLTAQKEDKKGRSA